MDIVIVDTGPLVAFFDKDDSYHKWSLKEGEQVKGQLITCEAVFVEAMYLLGNVVKRQQALFKLFEQSIIKIQFSLQNELSAVKDLMLRYQNVPMDLADACLVRMHELNTHSKIWTIDTDFYVYRRYANQIIDLIHPGE